MASIPVIELWNKIRLILLPLRQTLFFDSMNKKAFDDAKALSLLVNSDIRSEETFCFFDMIFDIS